jgi:hypothetical protein
LERKGATIEARFSQGGPDGFSTEGRIGRMNHKHFKLLKREINSRIVSNLSGKTSAS